MMQNVFVVTSVHSRFDVRIYYKQCRSAVSHGYNVTLVVQDGNGNECRNGVNIVDLGRPPSSRILRILLFSPWRAYRYIRTAQANIIHFHDPELLPVAIILNKLKKKCFIIYDSHEDFPRQILSKHWIPSLFRECLSKCLEKIENYAVSQLYAVICATPFIADRFININSNAVDINNFPMLDEFKFCTDRLAQRQPCLRTICYVGVITKERGLAELIKALELLQDVKLILCGPFANRAYEAELRLLNGWKYVDYRGVVARKEVVSVLNTSSVGIVTLLPTPNQINSLPIKMFEYMAAGLPVVASHFPLWKKIVEESNCGLCVDPSSPQEIANAIKTLLSNELMCRQMGAAGRQAVAERFNWSNEAEKLLELYRNALK